VELKCFADVLAVVPELGQRCALLDKLRQHRHELCVLRRDPQDKQRLLDKAKAALGRREQVFALLVALLDALQGLCAVRLEQRGGLAFVGADGIDSAGRRVCSRASDLLDVVEGLAHGGAVGAAEVLCIVA